MSVIYDFLGSLGRLVYLQDFVIIQVGTGGLEGLRRPLQQPSGGLWAPPPTGGELLFIFSLLPQPGEEVGTGWCVSCDKAQDSLEIGHWGLFPHLNFIYRLFYINGIRLYTVFFTFSLGILGVFV